MQRNYESMLKIFWKREVVIEKFYVTNLSACFQIDVLLRSTEVARSHLVSGRLTIVLESVHNLPELRNEISWKANYFQKNKYITEINSGSFCLGWLKHSKSSGDDSETFLKFTKISFNNKTHEIKLWIIVNRGALIK